MERNILFITRAYGENAGGMERLSFEMIQELKNHQEIKVTILANHTKKTSLFLSRINSIIFALTVIPRALTKARDADIIHIGDPVLSLIGYLIQRIYRKPIAVTVHGLDIMYDNTIYQSYLKLFFHQFDLYLPISNFIKTLLEKHNVKGTIKVVNPGVHDKMYDPNISQEQLESVIQKKVKDKHILFTSGRLVKRKGHEWFIRNVLPQLTENTIYVIAGNGPEYPHLITAAQQAHVTERVILLGRVETQTLKILYNTVDAFIQPNITNKHDIEGFGLVMLEAALCNRPVIASNTQGITDAIHNQKNGILVQPEHAEQWIQVITNVKPLKSPRQYTLDTFSWKKQGKTYASELITL